MDGNNLENGNVQNNETTQNTAQYSNYQDNTANIPYQAPVNNSGADNMANGKQIAGLVCGILAICSSCCYGLPGIILGVAGLICSILGNKENKNGVGTAGLVCSIIGLILGVIMLVYYVIIILAVVQDPDMAYLLNMYKELY